MSLHTAGQHMEGYRVNTTIYEGPLDLLLELIERAELDITRLAIAQVTNQYLEYIRNIRDLDPASVSAFLVMAARMLQIKSAVLLPRPPVVDRHTGEVDLGEDLAQQLILYRRFKQIAAWIMQREVAGLHTYLRLAPPTIKIDPRLDLEGIGLKELVEAGREILLFPISLTEISQIVVLPKISIREKVRQLLSALKDNTHLNFQSFLHTRNRAEAVVTFLALLELVKQHIVQAEQQTLFGDIQLEAIEIPVDPEAFELTYDE